MIGETIITCPICKSSDLQPHSTVVDHFGNQESFTLKCCRHCDTLVTTPRPQEKEIINYYKSGSYSSHGDSKGYLFDKIYGTVQKINFKRKHSILKKYTLEKRHLDFGCGTGSFLNYLHNRQWNVTGIEPDKQARSLAQEGNIAFDVHESLDKLPDDERYTSISLFHVLEHVHQLEDTLNKLVSILDRNGILILALPNYKSLDSQYYAEQWAGLDVPRHLYHFSQKSVHQLAKSFGLNIVATHPMTFDSYYVSLLSEQYKNGSKNYLRAFIHGFKSNTSAKKSNEYSSLIYVLSK